MDFKLKMFIQYYFYNNMEYKLTRKPCVIFQTVETFEDEGHDNSRKQSSTMVLVQAQLEDSSKNTYQFLNKKNVPETFVSQEIRVISEVEKIWILYDLDDNGTIDFDEMKLYIQETAFKSLKLSDSQLNEIYGTIDKDGNGTIDRDEMAQFLKLLIDM